MEVVDAAEVVDRTILATPLQPTKGCAKPLEETFLIMDRRRLPLIGCELFGRQSPSTVVIYMVKISAMSCRIKPLSPLPSQPYQMPSSFKIRHARL